VLLPTLPGLGMQPTVGNTRKQERAAPRVDADVLVRAGFGPARNLEETAPIGVRVPSPPL
jgi:hypothetical protein